MSYKPDVLLVTILSLFLCCQAEAQQRLLFNEIMQSNVDELMYRNDFPDSWVELYNPTTQVISLKNWSIGTENDLSKAYKFIHTLVFDAHGYGLIYCDKKDDGWEHTNFRLESTSKGRLYLWDNNGNLVDSLAYPKMPAPNIAYGRTTDGSWIHELTDTPGSANIEESGQLLPSPTFSVHGRLLQADEILRLRIEAPAQAGLPSDTRLYVTTDGSMPDMATSPAYDLNQGAEIVIDRTMVVRARLLSSQALPSLPVTHSYILHPRPTTLPILSLATNADYLYSAEQGILVGSDWSDNCYKNWRRPLNIEYFEQDSAEAIINQMGETKTHGVGSLLYSQKSLNLYAHKRFGKKKFDTHTFWPDKPQVEKSETFCIRNGGNRCLDTRFEDAFVQSLFGHHLDTIAYQAYRPVIAYINGEYRGIFGLRERSHESWVENNLGIDEDNVCVNENFYSDQPIYEEVRQLIDDPTSTYRDFAQRIDMPMFLNYLCAEAYATNDDYPHNNVWMWRDFTNEDDPFHPLLKDLDYMSRTLKTNWFNLMLNRAPENGAVVDVNRHKLFIRLFEMPEFREQFLDRMQTYLGDFCKPSVTVTMAHQMRADIDAEIAPTFALLTEGVDYSNFESKFSEQLIPYLQEWPMHLYTCMSATFGLGDVISLTVRTTNKTVSPSQPLQLTVNDIPLTEGDFEGACFGNRRFILDSNDPEMVWQVTIGHANGQNETLTLTDSRITVNPAQDFGPEVSSLEIIPIPRSSLMTQELIFNEIMQSNVDQLMYKGDFPDSWFEVYNPTAHTVNMKYWYIGTENDLTKAYQLRHTRTVRTHEYLLFYCDKKDDGWEHTDFRLESTSKGNLYLWNAQGELVDSLHYKKMKAPNVAYGRIGTQSSQWGQLITATPGSANANDTCSLMLPDPVFSIEGQLLAQGTTLTITAPDAPALPADTRLYVTTDGSAPTLTSASYGINEACQLQIDHTTVVRARLMSSQGLTPLPVTHSYIIHPRQTSLPILSISTNDEYLYDETIGMMLGSDFDSNCFKNWRRPFNIEFFEQSTPTQSLINQMGEAGMHGSGSLCRSQKSMNIYANKRFGKKRFTDATLFPHKPYIDKTKTFCIRNGGSNCLRTRFDDAFVQTLFGSHVDTLDYLDYRPVITYINGQYKGLFGLRERANDTWANNNYGLEEDSICEIESFTSDSPYYAEVRQLIEKPNATYQEFAQLIDLPIFLNYFCCQTYATNQSYPHDNVYMWLDGSHPGAKIHALLKDLDYVSMTQSTFNWVNYITLSGWEAAASTRPSSHQLLIKLLAMPEFYNPYLDRMQTYLGDFCKASVTVPMIESMRAEIDGELAATFDLMTENASYENFETLYNTTFITYCQQRPSLLYAELANHYELGEVIPLQVETYAATAPDTSTLLSIRINDIPLTEGDFDGACFSNRRTLLDCGDDDYGWQMKATLEDGREIKQTFSSSRIEFTPSEQPDAIRAIVFRPLSKSQLSITQIANDVNETATPYDLLGRKAQSSHPGILILHNNDGKSRMVICPN